MPIIEFPDPRMADEDGIVAIGGDLHPQSLLLAYRSGIFPWPDPSFPHMIWASPDPRGILVFSELHVPSRLLRQAHHKKYRYTIDQAFEAVVCACALSPRPGQDGTWITEKMIKA